MRFLAVVESLSLSARRTLVRVFLSMLQSITRLIGACTSNSTLFFLGEACLVVLRLNCAVQLSRTGIQIKTLGQNLSILRTRLDERTGRITDESH